MSDIPKPPKTSPVVIVGSCFVLGNLSIFIVESLKGLQIKMHSPAGLDTFDFSILLAGVIGSAAVNVAAFMNQSYSKLKADLEKHETELKKITETQWIKAELEKAKTT